MDTRLLIGSPALHCDCAKFKLSLMEVKSCILFRTLPPYIAVYVAEIKLTLPPYIAVYVAEIRLTLPPYIAVYVAEIRVTLPPYIAVCG